MRTDSDESDKTVPPESAPCRLSALEGRIDALRLRARLHLARGRRTRAARRRGLRLGARPAERAQRQPRALRPARRRRTRRARQRAAARRAARRAIRLGVLLAKALPRARQRRRDDEHLARGPLGNSASSAVDSRRGRRDTRMRAV